MNVAIILAAGVGNRMRNSIPKQFIVVAGKTVLEHSIDVFEKNTRIDEIVIILQKEYISEFEIFIKKNNWQKVKKVLAGGKERYESALAAVNAYQQFPDYNLIIHDAARPLVSDRIIDDVVNALERYNAVTVAVPITDTVYQVDDSQQFVKNIADRTFLQRAQTPQAFKAKIIQKGYEVALKDPDFQCSDDCGVVKKHLPEEKIFIVRGEEKNMKITYQEDVFLMEKILSLK